MVALHTGVLIASAVEVVALGRPFVLALAAPALALFALANVLRWWVIATLGLHWNVQVMGSMSLGVVTSGPYRWVRHPNYVAVFVELAALPLVHGAWITALAGAGLHVAVLRSRLRAEEAVLAGDDVYRAAMGDKPRFIPRFVPRFVPRSGHAQNQDASTETSPGSWPTS
jgi:methyltransferase